MTRRSEEDVLPLRITKQMVYKEDDQNRVTNDVVANGSVKLDVHSLAVIPYPYRYLILS